ncbi:hypothetical protein Tco_0824177 [Tanacetum coccineum]|uniref:Uncharacterized protein n=1 Tax=Tanacetum coccineum TaxID=301880 RepID=A0ABQ5AKY8_9ASTR
MFLMAQRFVPEFGIRNLLNPFASKLVNVLPLCSSNLVSVICLAIVIHNSVSVFVLRESYFEVHTVFSEADSDGGVMGFAYLLALVSSQFPDPCQELHAREMKIDIDLLRSKRVGCHIVSDHFHSSSC